MLIFLVYLTLFKVYSNRVSAVFLDVSSMIICVGFVIKSRISPNHFCKVGIFFMVHDTVKISTDCRAVWKSVHWLCSFRKNTRITVYIVKTIEKWLKYLKCLIPLVLRMKLFWFLEHFVLRQAFESKHCQKMMPQYIMTKMKHIFFVKQEALCDSVFTDFHAVND